MQFPQTILFHVPCYLPLLLILVFFSFFMTVNIFLDARNEKNGEKIFDTSITILEKNLLGWWDSVCWFCIEKLRKPHLLFRFSSHLFVFRSLFATFDACKINEYTSRYGEKVRHIMRCGLVCITSKLKFDWEFIYILYRSLAIYVDYVLFNFWFLLPC